VFTTIFKRIKAMISPEPKLVDEEAVAQCVNWDLAEVQLRCAALGIHAEAQKQLYVELFRTVTAEKWAEAERRIAYIRSRAFDGTPAAVAVELARGFVPPPVKSLKELERAARAWAAAHQHPDRLERRAGPRAATWPRSPVAAGRTAVNRMRAGNESGAAPRCAAGRVARSVPRRDRRSQQGPGNPQPGDGAARQGVV
jgi:hypothetical protein